MFLRNPIHRNSKLLSIIVIFFLIFVSIINMPMFKVSGSGPTFPTGTLSYVQITLTNNQAANVLTGTQVLISLDWNTYNSNLASNVQNVEFTDSSGTVIPAWCESFCSNTATTSNVWLKIDALITASGGTQTDYLIFFSTATNQYSSTGNWGANPTLTSTYAQYDNGAKIFLLYDNFNGTSVSSLWTQLLGTGGAISVNNGVTFTSPSTGTANAAILQSTATFSTPFVFEANVTSSVGVYPNVAETSGTATTFNGYALSYNSGFGNMYLYPTASSNNAYGGLSFVTYTGALGVVIGDWSVLWSSSAVQYVSWPGGSLSGTDSVYTLPSALNGDFGLMYSGTSASMTVQYAFARIMPPSNTMPSVSFGSISTNTITTTLTVTAWNVLNSSTSSAWVISFLFLMIFPAFFWGFMRMFGRGMSSNLVFLTLIALTFGSLIGVIAGTGYGTTTIIPMGMTIVYGSALVLYIFRHRSSGGATSE